MSRDRLSPIDSFLLHLDGPEAPLHIVELRFLDGPTIDMDAVVADLDARIHRLPRLRQKLERVPLGLNQPVWVDDPSFDVGHHVRHVTLPAPGGEDQLLRLTERITEQPLDRARPLWEMWFVDGIEGGRSATVWKVHHCVWDGIASSNMSAAILDTEPGATVTRAHWVPEARPFGVRLVAEALRDHAVTISGIRRQQPVREIAGELVRGVRDILRINLRWGPRTPFNAAAGPYRRHAYAAVPLEDFRTIRDAFGGSVNDIAMAASAGGIRTWLSERGLPVPARPLNVAVPISLRTEDDAELMGNKVGCLFTRLPVNEADPVRRLRLMQDLMATAKESSQKRALEMLTNAMHGFVTPAAHMVRLYARRQRHVNLVISNPPGPQFPLYMSGQRMRSIIPFAPIVGNLGLFIGISSLDGNVFFGVNANAVTVPDPDVIADGIRHAIDELLEAASARGRIRQMPSREKDRTDAADASSGVRGASGSEASGSPPG